MNRIREYIEGLFSDIPDNEQKTDIVQELIQNLEEKTQDLIDSGKSEEDAINKSLVDLGDVSEIKKSLAPAKSSNRKNINYANRLWFSVWASALIIGLFLFINFYSTPNAIWFVYPTFAVLWWPLASVFAWLNNRK